MYWIGWKIKMVLTPPVTRAVVCRVSACPSCPLCGRVSLCAGRDSCDRMCRVRGVSRARSVRRYPRANCYSRGRGLAGSRAASLTVFLPPRSLLYQLFAPRSGRGRSARAGLEPLVSHVPAWAPPGLGAPRCHDRGRHGVEAGPPVIVVHCGGPPLLTTLFLHCGGEGQRPTHFQASNSRE